MTNTENTLPDYIEATGLYTRHGFIVLAPVTDIEAQGALVDALVEGSYVRGTFESFTFAPNGGHVEIVTEYDPEDYWTD